jgi:hypothetical protein
MLRRDTVAIAGIYRGVPVTVKYDGRNFLSR